MNNALKTLTLVATITTIGWFTNETNFTQSALAQQVKSHSDRQSQPSLKLLDRQRENLLAQRLCTSYRVTREYGLYVYINGGKQIITTLPYGNIVTVTGLSGSGEWAKIQYLRVDGQTGEGWVAAAYLACYQE